MASEEVKEGRRVLQLRKALTKALDKSFGNFTAEDAMRCFKPEIRRKYGNVIEHYSAAVLVAIRQDIETEFGVILEERDLVNKLNRVDELEDLQPVVTISSEDSKPVQTRLPRLGGSNARIKNAVLEAKIKQKERLEELLKQLEEENKSLEQQVVKQQSEITSISEQLQAESQLIDQAVDTCRAGQPLSRSEGSSKS